MWQYNYSDELYHYGRKGMKWYQNIYSKYKDHKTAKRRKKNLEKARAVRAANKAAAEERRIKVESGKVSAKKMTDNELKERISRLDLEKKYNDLLRDSKSNTLGSRFVNKFLESTVDKIADNAASDIAAQSVKYVLAKGANKVIGSEQVYTNNKKK